MSSSSSPHLLLFFFSLLIPISSSSNTITLSLSTSTKPPNKTPWQRLNHLTSSSLARAHHLKHPHNTSLSKTPLFPRSYGEYSISLSFGSPPQTLDFVMDTGSSLVWFPCTRRYVCSKCNFPNVNPKNISTFIPKLSSSAKILGCSNPKCSLIYGSDFHTRCRDCDESSGNCSQTCPAYMLQYGSGTTAGILLSETLSFPDRVVNNFVVGCSIVSGGQPSGIAGFGRGPESLPAQMGIKKFSYCLVSHRFDDTHLSSELILVGPSSDSGEGTAGNVSYTPFHKNPRTSNSAFQDYYYVSLRKITVGGVKVKVPYRYLVPGSDGDGGTIVDSGTTFSYLDKEAYELVAEEFEKQMGQYSRSKNVEAETGLRPCYNISRQNTVIFPDLVFHFKGGAKMGLPLADFFSLLDGSGVVCMTIVSNNAAGVNSGPSIIIGNYQQQNFYMEFDLQKERLGFWKQICK